MIRICVASLMALSFDAEAQRPAPVPCASLEPGPQPDLPAALRPTKGEIKVSVGLCTGVVAGRPETAQIGRSVNADLDAAAMRWACSEIWSPWRDAKGQAVATCSRTVSIWWDAKEGGPIVGHSEDSPIALDSGEWAGWGPLPSPTPSRPNRR